MLTITATFPNGAIATWTDGKVEGSPPYVPELFDDPLEPNGLLTPEGPLLPVAEYASNPWAFLAALGVIFPDGQQPSVEVDGQMPPLYDDAPAP